VKEEEDAFLRTLEKGLKRIDDIITDTKGNVVDGKAAFELFDTFGFPIDLTRLIAIENKLSVDEAGFEKEMQQQKDRSRAATTIETEDWMDVITNNTVEFVGYDVTEVNSKVVKYRKVNIKGKQGCQIVLDKTPFYAESGGQVGDTGFLIFENEEIAVTDTKKENDLIVHFIEKLPVNISAVVHAKVDKERRKKITVHHSATHLMHAALRKVLGTHVAQKGSLVNDEYLRFDFSHFAKMTDEEIAKVETLVNEKIRENIPVVIKSMPKEEAIALGAMALFGEKYSDVVRVVIMDANYSIELCGGTHVGSTGELGFFKITSEGAVAAGVRRIEAFTGLAAEQYINHEFGSINTIRGLLKNPKDISKSIENLQNENTELKKKLERLEAKQLIGIRDELLQNQQQINGTVFIGDIVEVSNADALKKICFDLKNEIIGAYIVVLAANIDGKANVAVMIEEGLSVSKQLDAPKMIKEHIAPLIKGGGGGQKTLATAGGTEAGNLKEVIEKIKSLL